MIPRHACFRRTACRTFLYRPAIDIFPFCFAFNYTDGLVHLRLFYSLHEPARPSDFQRIHMRGPAQPKVLLQRQTSKAGAVGDFTDLFFPAAMKRNARSIAITVAS